MDEWDKIVARTWLWENIKFPSGLNTMSGAGEYRIVESEQYGEPHFEPQWRKDAGGSWQPFRRNTGGRCGVIVSVAFKPLREAEQWIESENQNRPVRAVHEYKVAA